VAREAVENVHAAGFQSSSDRRMTRFSRFKDIMAWQDALYVVNAHPDWRFSDEALCVGWLVELGGPEMGEDRRVRRTGRTQACMSVELVPCITTASMGTAPDGPCRSPIEVAHHAARLQARIG